MVLLGSAPDPRIQNDFVNLANQLHSSHNDRARLCLSYDEPLSHLVFSHGTKLLSYMLVITCVTHALLTIHIQCYADICWCRFHSCPFNIWTMWTNSTHSNEIRFNSCRTQNWRWEICSRYLRSQLHKIMICKKGYYLVSLQKYFYHLDT